MAVRFGATGDGKRIEQKVNDGELDCGTEVYLFIRSIDKTDMTIHSSGNCSYGILSNKCVESASAKFSQEPMARYKPAVPGSTPSDLQNMGNSGQAATVLDCLPMKIKSQTQEISATYKDAESIMSAQEMQNLTTIDGVISLKEGMPEPGTPQVMVSDSYEQPVDNFGTRTTSYRAREANPGSSNGTTLIFDNSLKQGDIPSISSGETHYGLPQITP